MNKNNSYEHKTMSDALKEFVKENRLNRGLDEVNITELWNSELGPAVKKYTTGVKLQREVLYVQLSNSVLRQELSYGKTKIIQLLNEAMGKEIIKKLVLR